MKIEIAEHDHGFFLDLTAETLPEAALLTRLGMNSQGKDWSTYVQKNGSFSAHHRVKQRARGSSFVPRQK